MCTSAVLADASTGKLASHKALATQRNIGKFLPVSSLWGIDGRAKQPRSRSRDKSKDFDEPLVGLRDCCQLLV